MSFVDDPVINSPFEQPNRHHQLNQEGQPTGIVSTGRRESMLNSTVSRAFPRPATGRICVKVINHFGDEVQKVFDV